jgi:hypothetical protein
MFRAMGGSMREKSNSRALAVLILTLTLIMVLSLGLTWLLAVKVSAHTMMGW